MLRHGELDADELDIIDMPARCGGTTVSSRNPSLHLQTVDRANKYLTPMPSPLARAMANAHFAVNTLSECP